MKLPLAGRVVSVNVAASLRPEPWADMPRGTGIDKRAVQGRVSVRDDQVGGDHIGNTRVHGGYDQAVYAYAREDAAWWATDLGRELPPGSFGENLSTEGVDVTGAVIGERWAVGSALLEVSSPRIPCTVFAGFWDVPRLIKRFTERGWPGAYLRIITPGDVGAGDAVEVVHRPAHGVTIGETFRALSGDRELAPRLLELPELPEKYRERVLKWLSTPAPSGA